MPARAVGPGAANPAAGLNQAAIQSVKRMMGMYKAAKNKQASLQMIAQQNPQINGILQICGPGGLRNSFYQLCKEQGVDPEEVLRQLQ